MQGPEGGDEDGSDGFWHGGWLVPIADEDMNRIVSSWFASTDAFLLGHTTYDQFRRFWPQVAQDDVIFREINTLPKFVAATGAVDVGPWSAPPVGSDVVAEIRRLKPRNPARTQIHGRHALLQALHGSGLIDEYRLLVFPLSSGRAATVRAGADTEQFSGRVREPRAAVRLSDLVPTTFSAGTFAVANGREVAVND